jgi:hypothetical protein
MAAEPARLGCRPRCARPRLGRRDRLQIRVRHEPRSRPARHSPASREPLGRHGRPHEVAITGRSGRGAVDSSSRLVVPTFCLRRTAECRTTSRALPSVQSELRGAAPLRRDDRYRRGTRALVLARRMPRQRRSDHRWGARGCSAGFARSPAWLGVVCCLPVTGCAGRRWRG